jgi:ribosome maturation factor RimP
VDVVVKVGNEIEVEIDKPEGLDISDCVMVTRAIEGAFDRDVEDYELTVTSPGLGQVLKVQQQYLKLIDKEVEVLLKSGEKFTAILRKAEENEIAVEYKQKQLVDGQKQKQLTQTNKTIAKSDIKHVKAVVKV